MPDKNNRNSLDLNLDGRQHNQRAGGAFDVKKTLGQPHTSVPAGKIIDASSAKGQEFQNPNGFETKVPMGESRLKMVQSGGKQGVSTNAPGPQATIAGQIVDAASSNAQNFQSPNGFEVKVPIMESRLKVVQSGGKSGVSRYVRGLDTRKYSNAIPFHTT
jgi:hypothetical protein